MDDVPRRDRWVLLALVMLAAILLAGAVHELDDPPGPELAMSAPDFLGVALSHAQQRNVTLVLASAARDGAGGAVPMLIVPEDLEALDTYAPDIHDDPALPDLGRARPALAVWLLERWTAGQVVAEDYDPSTPPAPASSSANVRDYPLGVTRIGAGNCYRLYCGERDSTILLIAEDATGAGG